jgi:glycosyltransferase involved in cell wall biosynthesis
MAPASAGDGPFVSVGMPVFNGESFLRQAIDSMLAQSHANLELIISDNASTDRSAAIAAEYATRDPRVRYFLQPRNIGAVRNYNFVAARARGKYLKWASANDYCDTAMLAACIEVLEAQPRSVLCYGTTRLVDEVTGVVQPYNGDFSIAEERPSARFYRVLTEMRLNNAFNGLIRMEALGKTGLNRRYPSGDLVLMAELAMAGTFVLLPRPFLYRRVGAHTFSSQLSDTELRYFIDPEAKSDAGLGRLRMNIDYFTSVLRASMSFREKQRALTFLAHRAYWDVRKMIGRPRRASDVHP